MKPLFQLSEDILALEAELERDDLSDEQRAALVDAWLETQGDVAAKLDNYAALIRELDARSETRAAEARRLVALANADAERMASLSARLKAYFERHNLKNFSTARYKLSLQRNGGKMPIVIEVEPERLPEEFHRVIPARIEADRDKLREALEAASAARHALSARFDWGDIDEDTYLAEIAKIPAIPGARLGERGISIRIR